MDINLSASAGDDGHVFGNIVSSAFDDTINVIGGKTVFDGYVLDTAGGTATLNIDSDGNLELVNSVLNGISGANVDTFNQGADGTITYQLRPDGTAGQINAATLANVDGHLVAAPQAGLYADNTVFEDVVISGNPINGTWDTVTSTSPLLDVTAVYNTNDYDLNADRVAFNAVSGLNANQLAVASAIEGTYSTSLTGDYGDFVGSLFALNSGEYAAALAALGGAQHAQALQSMVQSFNGLNSVLGERLRTAGGGGAPVLGYAEDPNAPLTTAALGGGGYGWTVWARGNHSWGSLAGDVNAGGFDFSQTGGYFGADRRIGPNATIGLAGGYLGTSLDFSNASVDYSGFQIAGYGAWDNTITYVHGVLAYGGYDGSSLRPMPGGAAAGDFRANAVSGYGEIGHRLRMGATQLTPFAGLSLVTARIGSFTETGPGALTVDAARGNSLSSTLGARLSTDFAVGDGMTLTPELRVAWQHEFLDAPTVGSSFNGAPAGTSFTVTGSDPVRNLAVIGVGTTLTMQGGAELMLDYQGRFGAGFNESTVTGRFNYKF